MAVPVVAATLDSGRLEALTDGVMAVAMTLLALDLRVDGPGSGALAHQLVDRWPSLAAYLVSFFTVGIVWVNHHALFRNLVRVDRVILFLNLVLLSFVAAIPFATATLASYLRSGGDDAHLAAALYGGVFEGLGLSFGCIFAWSITRDHLRQPLTGVAARRAWWRFGLGNVAYVVAAALAFVSAVLALGLYALISTYYMFEQTPRQAAKGASASPPTPEL